jgi:hypothetical protein
MAVLVRPSAARRKIRISRSVRSAGPEVAVARPSLARWRRRARSSAVVSGRWMTLRRSRSSSVKSLPARLSAMPMISEAAAESPNAIWYSTGIQRKYSPYRFRRWKSRRLRKSLIMTGPASPVSR